MSAAPPPQPSAAVAADPARAGASPYRGIESFRYLDQSIFFARGSESARLLRLVTMYRGVLLYGDSGAGKSSLINARFIPDAIAEGFRPERVRVQPVVGEEIVLERIAISEGPETRYLPSNFPVRAEGEARLLLAAQDLRATLAGAPAATADGTELGQGAAAADGQQGPGSHALLIFDQFEELITLFEEAPRDAAALAAAGRAQAHIIDAIVALLRDEALPVKLLFVFREDYLAKLNKLFLRYPDLVDHRLRLESPPITQLSAIVRGPLREHPERFADRISDALADDLEREIATRSPSGLLNLSEVQIACLRLWQAPEPAALFAQKGVAGLLEDYSLDALNRLPELDRDAAVALLSRLVTGAGTRNIVSGEDLLAGVRAEEGISAATAESALGALVRDAKLVRRELRHDTLFYEIVSEFLVPWITRQKAARQTQARERVLAEQARGREQQAIEDERARVKDLRRKRMKWAIAALVTTLLIMAALLYQAVVASREATAKEKKAETFQQWAEYEKGEAEKERADAEKERDAALQAKEQTERALVVALRESKGRALDRLRREFDGKVLAAAQLQAKEDGAPPQDTPPAPPRPPTPAPPATSGVIILEGHTGDIWTARFSPDGARVVTASRDHTARIFETTTGKSLQVLTGHTGEVNTASFSPDGHSVVTASDDYTARLWDAANGTLRHELKGHANTVGYAAWSPDGSLVGTASKDGTARIWNAHEGTVASVLRGHTGSVWSVEFHPNGTLAITASADGTARLWDVRDGRQLAVLPHTPGTPVRRAFFSHDGSMAVSCGRDNFARLWDAKTGAPLRALEQRGPVRDATFGPADRRLATASANGATIWEARTGERRFNLDKHSASVWIAAFSPDGKTVLTASWDKTARLWDAATGRPTTLLSGHTDVLWFAAFGPDGRRVVTSSADKTARIWELDRLPAAAHSNATAAGAVPKKTGRAGLAQAGVTNAAPSPE